LYVAPTGAWLVETPRLPHLAKGAGDLFAALFTARRAGGQSLVVALEAAVGAVHDVIVRSMLTGADGLAIIEAQDKLEFPDTWPTARQFRP
jgi:pyridoxine kinase